jgi:hypothetical protein
MRPPFSPPAVVRLNPRAEPGGKAGVPKRLPRGGKGWPHAEVTVAAVRHLIEETTLTYKEIATRTGTSMAGISRWKAEGGWTRPLFAPRSPHTMPTPRATAYLKRRQLAARLATLAERYVRELEEAANIDLDKLGEALELSKMARLAAMSRTAKRKDAVVLEPMRPVIELCSVGVDLRRAPREALDDFLEHRAAPPEDEKPPRSRGRSTPKYLRRARQHAWMLDRE